MSPQPRPPVDAGLLPSGDTRHRLVQHRSGLVVGATLLVLGAALLVQLLRAPADLLVLLQVVAFAFLAGALVVRSQISRLMVARRDAREEGIKRMLQGMSRSVSSEAIVQAIVDELRRSADADHVAVARLRPVDRVVETTLVSSRARVPPSRSTLPARVLNPNALRGAAQRSAAGDGDAPESLEQRVAEDLARRLATTYALRHTLAEPLVAGQDIIGALILSRRQEREWSAADRRLLSWTAHELSAALARAYAFEEAEVRANIDALTGLPNRRYLEELLATIGPRRRAAEHLGALMIDIDHFKRLNDRWGHATGDRVLRAVGERIAAAVRGDDTPVRYGGEEFAVVLRRAGADQALEVAERIREQIGAIPPAELGVTEPIRVSIGVAVAVGLEIDFGRLLAAADEALYRAKSAGRNRVVLAR